MTSKNRLPSIKLTVFLLVISSVALFANNYSYAANQLDQYFKVSNNGTIIARASSREITRIAFNSEVTDVNAIAGELEYTVNGRDIYLRASSEKPVNFFVKLENGWTLKFILSAEDIPANQIFVNMGTSRILAQTNNQLGGLSKTHEQVSPLLKKRLEKIISVAVYPTKHIGYEIIPSDKSISTPFKDLDMRLIGTIKGDMLIAERINITNKTMETKKISLSQFMNKQSLAVYLSKTLLSPQEQAVLIRISEN